MEQSLIAAVTGIQANQTYLDVIGSNIANSNTTAYKSESAVFTDLLAEQVAGAAAPLPNQQGAGINPVAIGSGVRVAAVAENQNQGTIEQTNVPTDVAIQGQGYLVATVGGQQMFTRAGSLTIDANGQLATPTGGLIQGWNATPAGAITTNAPTTGVVIPNGQVMPGQATANVTLNGNLPLTANPTTVTVNTYDGLGNSTPIALTFTPPTTATGNWSVSESVNGGTPTSVGTFSFGAGGTTPTPTTLALSGGITLNLGTITEYSGQNTLQASQDGFGAGTLESFSIGSDGVVTGAFSNGRTQKLAQLALATFANPGGLADQGNLMYAPTANSGAANIGTAGTGGRGTLVGGALESSNVNLANQLTNLIVAQENYQANTKVITTTDQAIQALMAMP